MRIGFNAQLLVNPVRSGIEHYIFYLLDSLAKIDNDNEYIVFCKRETDLPEVILKKNNFMPYVSSLPLAMRSVRALRENFLFPLHIFKKNIDVYHGTHFMLPLIVNCPSVVTFHDIVFIKGLDLDTYETSSWLSKVYLNLFIPRAAYKATRIISVSDSTKEDIVKELNIHPDKIVTVYHGIDESFKRIGDRNYLEKTRSIFSLPKEYILFAGALKPRRNVSRLFEAYSILKKKYKLIHQLVIAGQKDQKYKEVFSTIEKSGLDKDIMFIGNVDHRFLPAIYNMASLFIYPSLYDGFGFPPLEAMACGIPVVTSNVSSLPEIVGDAALLVDPYNIEAMAEAMWKVLNNKELSRVMAEKGIKRAAKFTWERCAKETLKIYSNVYKSA